TDAGLWIPRRQRPPKVYQPRARRACVGELIQIDGSDHRWFEERAPPHTPPPRLPPCSRRIAIPSDSAEDLSCATP
ncbi:hypothetical protein DF034_17555, partial [Burkholderia anthina]